MKDYFYILGVSPNASQEEIKSAYRKLSLKLHPDKNGGDKFSEDRFKEINEAYLILGNLEKRIQYDIKRNEYNAQSSVKSDNNTTVKGKEKKENNEENFYKKFQ